MATDSLGQLTVDLVANTGSFEAGMTRAERALKSATKEAAYQGNQLDKLVGQIDPVTGSLLRLDKMEEQLRAHRKANRLDVQEFDVYLKKLNEQRAALQSTDATYGKVGMSAKAMAASMRGVPAQFTDIVVSLQGGQAPMTVLLQQGGQLKDMFGGLGPAAKALGGYVGGMVNPFTVAAATVVALGAVVIAAHSQFNEYNKALLSTGNAAGTTADQLSLLSNTLAGGRNFAEAGEAVLALAKNGRLSGEAFSEVARAATEMAVATGKGAAEIADQLSNTKSSVTAMAVEYSDKYGVVTLATLEQVRALELQGDKMGAIKLLAGTVADEMSKRNKEMVDSTRGLAKAWDDVKTSVADVYNQIKSGLSASPELFKLQHLQGQLEDARQIGDKALIKGLEEQVALAQKAVDLQSKKNEGIANEVLDRKTIIAADAEWNTDGEKYLSNRVKMEKEIATARRKGLEAGKSQLEIDRRVADIQDEYKKKEPKAKTYQEDAGQRMLDNARQQYAVLQSQSMQIGIQGEATAKLGTEAKKLIELEQQIADLKEKKILTTDQKQILASADLNVAQQKRNADLEKENALRLKSFDELQKLASFQESVNDKLALDQQGLDNALSGLGLGAEGRKQLQDDLKIQQDYQKEVARLQRDLRNDKITQETYDKETAILDAALDKRLSMQEDYYARLKVAQSDWKNGANAALQDYASESNDIANQTYGVVSNGLSALEDQFVSVFTTGKFSFKDLANSIIADLARMLAKAYVVMPILGALGLSGSSGGGGGGVAGAWSSITGGEGGGGGITSMISSAKTVIDVASSKFGESLINGWNSGGESLIDSLSGAFDGGASYVSDAISSAFTAGSATASVAAEATAATFSAGITESAAAIGSQFSAEIGGAALSYEAASAASANALSSTLGTLSTALSVIGTAYTVFTAFQDYGIEGGLTTAGFAAAGAAIGSVVPVIGTAIGAAIGAVIGSIASASWFGGPNYEQLVSSAEGSYSDGKFKDEGWYDGWKENKTRLGAGTDGKLMSYVQQFTSTMGMLYDALGDGSDVSAAVTMRRRETSGDWSNGMAATLDNGVQITALKQYGLDVDANLEAYYDDFMGTFLSQAIVSSESLPQYFKNQFEAYSTDWEVSADTVIAAIEGVFTRFNGVNSALGQINVAGLKLNETGMIASDSILNMVASLADLDSESATAKEKVDALNQLVNGYYSVFFTAEEQFADLTSSLKGSFAGFGLALPDTREAYRAMVEDIDVTTSAGQAMFATMMGLATAADSYYKGIDAQAQAAIQASANYYDLFATDGQKAIDTLASVGAQFKGLGLALPANRDGFVAMMGSIDQTTEKGKALFASLLGLATSADAAFDIIEANAAASAQALITGATTVQSAVQRAVTAQQKIVTDAYNVSTEALNTALSAASTSVSDLTSVGSDLSNALKALRGDSDAAVKMLRSQAKATLDNALATARAGGSLAGFAGLDDALDVASQMDPELYASLDDFEREQGRTANVIAALNELNGKQLTSAEKTVKALEDQLKLAEDNYKLQMDRFDSQLEFAQAQIDALNGVDTSIMGVTAAVNAMNAAVVAALAGISGSASAGTSTNNGTLIDSVYNQLLGRDADADGKKYWQDQLASGAIAYAQLAQAIANAAREKGQAIKVPGYAKGTGDWDGSPVLVGEHGAEIVMANNLGSSSIYPAQRSRSILSAGSGNSGGTDTDTQNFRERIVKILNQVSRAVGWLDIWNSDGLPAVRT
jgi:lambda family phage tail tape measure protein